MHKNKLNVDPLIKTLLHSAIQALNKPTTSASTCSWDVNGILDCSVVQLVCNLAFFHPFFPLVLLTKCDMCCSLVTYGWDLDAKDWACRCILPKDTNTLIFILIFNVSEGGVSLIDYLEMTWFLITLPPTKFPLVLITCPVSSGCLCFVKRLQGWIISTLMLKVLFFLWVCFSWVFCTSNGKQISYLQIIVQFNPHVFCQIIN